MRCVLLAIAVLGVALTLQGCGAPPFVLDECESKLTYLLANSTIDGVVDAQTACKATFKSLRQQQLCATQEMTTIQKAKAQLLKPYIKQCGEFVMAEACPKKSDCAGKPGNLKASAAFAAVDSFFSYKSSSVLGHYATTLRESIKAVTRQHYDQKYNSRVVPEAVKTYCTLYTETNVDDVRLTQPPISALSIKCNDQEKAARQGGAWYTACVSAGTEAIIKGLSMWKNNFISRCAAGTLTAVCPKGSACAIETSTADPQALMAQAQVWVTKSYSPAQAQVLVTLGNVVTSWVFNGAPGAPDDRLFEVNGLDVTTTHLATGGVYFGAGFAIVGLGALLVARRRTQASMEGQAILVEEELEAELE